MKNLITIFLSLVTVNLAAADICFERAVEVIAPALPTSIGAQHAIQKGPCSVTLNYSITASGKVINIKSSVEEERCKYFKHSAERTLRKSIFKTGEKNCDCKHRYVFGYE